MIHIKSYQEEHDFHISIEGDLDSSNSIYLDQALQKATYASKKRIIVDCRQLNFISSAGLGVLMSYLLLLKERECELILIHVSQHIVNIFHLLSMDAHMKILTEGLDPVS